MVMALIVNLIIINNNNNDIRCVIIKLESEWGNMSRTFIYTSLEAEVQGHNHTQTV